MKRYAILLVGLVILASWMGGENFSNKDWSKFEDWANEYGLIFENVEKEYRRAIFLKNYESIESHNSQTFKSYEQGLNQFSHLTPQQFAQTYLRSGYTSNINPTTIQIQNQQKFNLKVNNPSNDIDWERLGKVSVVKNQGSCDAGYAFCSVSLAQSYYLMKGTNLTFSEQQVIDCSDSYGTFGCSGGSRAGTLKFLIEKNISLESKYPYKGSKGTCAKQTGDNPVKFVTFEANGCAQLQSKLLTSPMTVAVNSENWQFYKSGIYDGCKSLEVNHDVYLVGVVSDKYWRIKNSWGLKWGQYGYIRLNFGNTCGICSKPGFGFSN